MTGVDPSKHGVVKNHTYDTKSSLYKSWMWYGKNEFDIDPLVIVCWNDIEGNIIEYDAAKFIVKDYIVDTDLDVKSTPSLSSEELSIIQNGDHQMILVSFDTTDYVGHKYGFDHDEPKYIKAVEKVDAQIQAVLDAIESRPQRENEEWLVVLSTDHSGKWIDHEWFFAAGEAR